MAIFILTNAQVIINGVDLSDHSTKITCTDSRAEVDVSAFASTYMSYTKGLGTAEISVDFLQDFQAAKVHATLQPLVASTSAITVEVRPVAAARSATNPAFYMASALMFEYAGLDGGIGEVAKMTATFKNAPGGAGMTYPTA